MADDDAGVGLARAGEQHAELIPAEPSDGIHRTQHVAYPPYCFAQQLIACGVAVAIVDVHEVIEVEHGER